MHASRSLIFSIALALGLTACGGDTPSSTGPRANAYLATGVQSAQLTLAGKVEDYRIERVAGTVQFTHLQTALVTRVADGSRVRFSDFTLATDVDGNAGKVYRLYKAAFNRTPDVRGLSYWIEAMDKGTTLDQIAQGFATSTEFRTVYGINPTESEIIARFYQNVLGREGEPVGVAFWVDTLRYKRATVAAVLAGFSESPENQFAVYQVIGNGIRYREDGASYIVVAEAGADRAGTVGTALTLDGTESLNGVTTLTYQWEITSRPSGSSAQLLNPATAFPTFTPDKVGNYTVSLQVSDGTTVDTDTTTVSVYPASLTFAPTASRYSRGLEKLVLASTGPNVLKLVDPLTAAVTTVSLPTTVKAFNLSPDGKLAIVLHESVASLVDLVSLTVVKSFATGGSHTDAFVTNNGIAYFIGQTGGQWVDRPIVYFNARTGQDLSANQAPTGFGYFYGTQYGVLVSSLNKVLVMSTGLSPSDISYFTFDPTTNAVTQSGESPYHGDYSMSPPLFLSENESLVFTASGNFFYTDTLRYAGTFGLQQRQVISVSNSIAGDETLVLASAASYTWDPVVYPSEYHRYAGSLLFADGTVKLPMVEGKQSYGIKIWHNASGQRFALVQTGSAKQELSVKYYVIQL